MDGIIAVPEVLLATGTASGVEITFTTLQVNVFDWFNNVFTGKI